MAREGYLVNAGEETIHDSEAEKRAEQKNSTPHGKWNNFWYYHKFHVLIALIAAAVVGYLVWNTAQTVTPDYTIGLITEKGYPQQVLDGLQTEIEKYGQDLNHDGKVVVNIVQYYPEIPQKESKAPSSAAGSSPKPSDFRDPQALMASQTKFLTDLSEGTSMIFITDSKSFAMQEQAEGGMFAYFDGTTPKKGEKDYSKLRVPLSKCPKLANQKITFQTDSGASATQRLGDLMKDESISLRVYYGSSAEGKNKSYFEASKTLFQKLILQK
jgi:hypothetical protein